MLGLVLVTHAPLGDAIAQCVKHVMGSLPDGLAVVDVPGDEDIEQSVQRIQVAARQVHAGEGVVFLTESLKFSVYILRYSLSNRVVYRTIRRLSVSWCITCWELAMTFIAPIEDCGIPPHRLLSP